MKPGLKRGAGNLHCLWDSSLILHDFCTYQSVVRITQVCGSFSICGMYVPVMLSAHRDTEHVFGVFTDLLQVL